MAWDKKDMTVSVRLDEATVKGLKQLAALDDRKLSPYIARLLRQHVEVAEAAGKLKPARGEGKKR
jgi:predicted transcriptional regulator